MSARLTVWRSPRSRAANSAGVAANTSSPPRSNSASAARPATTCSDARFFGLASVNTSEPAGKSNAASATFFASFAPRGFHRSRPAIIRWITTKRSPSTPITIRLPSRSTVSTFAPTSSFGAGLTVRSTNGLAIRIASIGCPIACARRRST